jgi:hypothetical protein
MNSLTHFSIKGLLPVMQQGPTVDALRKVFWNKITNSGLLSACFSVHNPHDLFMGNHKLKQLQIKSSHSVYVKYRAMKNSELNR